jgi:deoxycytidylate deaminase
MCKFKTMAYEVCEFSKQKFKHGCIITKNSKVITYGVNQGMRTKCLNNIRSCVHAEIDAANKLIKILRKKHGKNYKTHISKYTLWVVRIPNSKHNNVKVIESKPCYYCTRDLYNLGFEKIAYSTNNNSIVYDKLSNLIKSKLHKSNLQKRIEQYY